MKTYRKLPTFGDEFRAEAIRLAGRPAERVVQGWKFLLSTGDPKMSEKEYESLRKNVHSEFGRKVAAGLPATYAEYELERARLDRDTTAAGMVTRKWLFSASLHPRDRATTDRDWEYLGAMAGAVRAPEKSLQTPIATTDPRDVFYWTWAELSPVATQKGGAA